MASTGSADARFTHCRTPAQRWGLAAAETTMLTIPTANTMASNRYCVAREL
jgi:hypothetical protein